MGVHTWVAQMQERGWVIDEASARLPRGGLINGQHRLRRMVGELVDNRAIARRRRRVVRVSRMKALARRRRR